MNVNEARRQFPHTWTDMIYLNHAAISPLSFRVRDAVDLYLTRRSLEAIDPFPWGLRMVEETRTLIGKLLHSRSDQIAFVLNTSDGLNILAQGLDWKSGDRIILNDLEFPSNVYPFLNLKRKGVEIDIVKSHDNKIWLEDFENAITPRTRLCSISHVQYSTGQRVDLKKLGEILSAKNILFAVDAIQSLPHSFIDVQDFHIDFISTGSHKWLMSPEGAGFIFVSDRALEQIHQASLGWASVSDQFNFSDIDPARLRPDASRFENGLLNFPGIAGLRASLEFVFEFGRDELERAVLANTNYLAHRLETLGIEMVSPKEESERSGIVSFKIENAEAMHKKLLDKNIVTSLRNGNIRVSPNFYNTEEELKRFMAALYEE